MNKGKRQRRVNVPLWEPIPEQPLTLPEEQPNTEGTEEPIEVPNWPQPERVPAEVVWGLLQ